MSLICNQTLDLTDKRVLMFSYGSGCAASMFVLRFRAGYKNIQRITYYNDRLNSRTRVSPEDYDREMTRREEHFGLANQRPTGSIDHILEGSYYLTNIDKNYIRYYALKTGDSKSTDEGTADPKLPLAPVRVKSSATMDSTMKAKGRLGVLNHQFAPKK